MRRHLVPRVRQRTVILIRSAFGPLLILLSALGCDACEGNARNASSTLNIYAASSLTDVLRELAAAFEAEHPQSDIQVNFAGSQTLRFQIEQGAQAHVFISASESHIERLTTSQGFANIGPIATNQLALVVPRNNPAAIDRFEDLRRARRIVLGGVDVPIGHYTRRCLNNASHEYGAAFLNDVRQSIVSEEHNVRAVRTKILLGEADAAFVYQSDTVDQPDLRQVTIPASLNVEVSYWMAIRQNTSVASSLHAWQQFLGGPHARRIFEQHGFGPIPN